MVEGSDGQKKWIFEKVLWGTWELNSALEICRKIHENHLVKVLPIMTPQSCNSASVATKEAQNLIFS
ncbi:Anion Exchange Transporter [Manis pentadactyla]|nr:Anion Exchange Transporter [Manis pentadactyla]